MSLVKVYGADWCAMTRRTLSHLDELGVAYEYINVDEDPAAAEWVKAQNGGREKKPTVEIAGSVMTYPTRSHLEETLRRHNALQGPGSD
jgi:mycoredoxin